VTVPVRPERETLEAIERDARWIVGQIQRVPDRPINEVARTIVDRCVAALAVAPDARLAERYDDLLDNALLLMDQHISVEVRKEAGRRIIEGHAAAREGTRSGGDAT
jgi:hypothetical protein